MTDGPVIGGDNLPHTGKGSKLKITGNTNKKVKIKKIEIHEDKIKIAEGTLMTKNWHTIYYRDIRSFDKGIMKDKIVTDSNDYSISGGTVLATYETYIRHRIEQSQQSGGETSGGGSTTSDAEELEKFAELNEKGVISDEELEQKKDEIL